MSYKPPTGFKLSEQDNMSDDQQNMDLLLIQVPKKFDIGQLNGVEYVPGQITDIVRDDSLPGSMSAVYQLASNTTQELDLKQLVKHNNKLVVGPSIGGHLSVTKSYRVESKPSQYTLPSMRRPGPPLVPMPEGLKARFTPFGSGNPSSCRLSAASPAEELPEKKKKRKKKKDKDQNVIVKPSSSRHENSTISQSINSAELADRLSECTETSQEEQGEQTPVEQRKHKKKKHKEKKKALEADFVSPKTNGSVDFNDSLACAGVKGILSGSAKAKKHKKNVSFSLDESVFMNSSGDASRLDPPQSREDEAKPDINNSQDSSDVNGNSLHSQNETVKSGKKRKRSSGYSSADTSLEPSSPSEVQVKKKKKKHKALRMDL